ncbi:hypothetical protein [Flavobacterium sp. 83]|uniref:hypothetical protein n=1 Tax=Flavobacterium sp. 83 TaxID=1131812 RepID=UPI0005534F2B|nr:hypothetical protein [Flavobacterium sp. 83]
MQEIKKVTVKVPQAYLDLMNQIFEIEKKTLNLKEENSIQRNINKINGLLEDGIFNDVGLSSYNPLGENYSDTRTDCEATISGTSIENLEIVEVIKPIIFYTYKENGNVMKIIAQPAVVIVQSKNIHK